MVVLKQRFGAGGLSAVSSISNSSWTEDGQQGTAFCPPSSVRIMRHQAVHADNGKQMVLLQQTAWLRGWR
jgi:hypothetical protein